jgi:hypothetical protein
MNALFMQGSAGERENAFHVGGMAGMETKMKSFTKWVMGAVMMAGVAVAAAPASAQVSVGIGFGPGYGYGYGPGGGYANACNYYSRWYNPYRCRWNYGYYSSGPIWWGNSWYNGPTRYRYWGGHREYYLGGGWRRDGYRFGGGGYRGGYGGGRGYYGGGRGGWR